MGIKEMDIIKKDITNKGEIDIIILMLMKYLINLKNLINKLI
jgi:hypothetical protein